MTKKKNGTSKNSNNNKHFHSDRLHVLVTFVAVVVLLLRFYFSRAGQAMAVRDLR